MMLNQLHVPKKVFGFGLNSLLIYKSKLFSSTCSLVRTGDDSLQSITNTGSRCSTYSNLNSIMANDRISRNYLHKRKRNFFSSVWNKKVSSNTNSISSHVNIVLNGTNVDDIKTVEDYANSNPDNDFAQENYLKAIVNLNGEEEIIKRYESGKYKMNQNCKYIYIACCLKLNRIDNLKISLTSTPNTTTSTFTSTSTSTNFNSVNVPLPPNSMYTTANNTMNNNNNNSNSPVNDIHAPNHPQNFDIENNYNRNDGKENFEPLQVMIVTSKQDRILSMIKFIFGLTVPACIFMMLYMYINNSFEEGNNLSGSSNTSSNSSSGSNISKAHTCILSGDIETRFKDVKGVDSAKNELEEVVSYLKDSEKFIKLGAKLPKGVLLVGEPGCGKTLLARAVAGEANVPFFYVSGSAFDEMFVGVGPRRVRDLFNDARKSSPCIIFIDELDAVGVARKYSMSGGSYAKESTLNQLLTEMDGFKQTEGIIVIAATNLPETLDNALVRPGRFDKQIVVPTPDVLGRKEIIDLYLNKTKVSPDVNSETIARGTTGFSGAELSNLINLAAIKAAVSGLPQINMETIEDAKDDIIMGNKKKGIIQTEEDLKLTAYHEGGHALVAIYSEGSHPIHKATIIHRGNALGTTSFLPERDELSITRKQMLSRLMVAMGGRAAEELIFGEENVTTGASSDFANATNLARGMVTKLGFSDKVGNVFHDGKIKISEKELELIDQEVKLILKQSYNDAKKILKDHQNELHLIAESLLKNETLSAEEIKQVIAGIPINKFNDQLNHNTNNNNNNNNKNMQHSENNKHQRESENKILVRGNEKGANTNTIFASDSL